MARDGGSSGLIDQFSPPSGILSLELIFLHFHSPGRRAAEMRGLCPLHSPFCPLLEMKAARNIAHAEAREMRSWGLFDVREIAVKSTLPQRQRTGCHQAVPWEAWGLGNSSESFAGV